MPPAVPAGHKSPYGPDEDDFMYARYNDGFFPTQIFYITV